MQRKELIKTLLVQVRELEGEFYSRLSEQELARTGSPARWSARDLQAHIASWKARMADNLLAVKSGHTPQPVENYDRENAALFEEHCSKTWQQV